MELNNWKKVFIENTNVACTVYSNKRLPQMEFASMLNNIPTSIVKKIWE